MEQDDLQERYRLVLAASSDGVWDWNLLTGELYWSERLLAMVGLAPADFVPHIETFFTRLHPDDERHVRSVVQRHLRRQGPFDVRCRLMHEDGRCLYTSARGQASWDESGRPTRLAGTVTDITASVQARRALVESETRFMDMAANIPGAIFRYVMHPDGSDGIEYMSPGCVEIWEVPAAEIQGDPARLWALVHPDDVDDMHRSVVHSMRTLTRWSHRFRITTPSGKRKWLDGRGAPKRHDDGAVTWNSLILDVTEQETTERELRQSRELIHQAQKLDAVGKLTGGIAHDFNNLLAIVLGSLELLRDDPDPDARTEYIDDALEATLRGRELTNGLLSFARRATLEPEELDLNEVVEKMQRLFRRTLPETISVRADLAPGLWPTRADRNAAESALLNLVVNARDAMPEGGRVTIRTRNVQIGATDASGSGGALPAGGYVEVAVEDTGEGIAPELLERVFEPFFSTKEAGHGTGLGLSMVHGFLRQSGGTVHIDSAPGHGTTVRLLFRAAPAGGDESVENRRGAAAGATAAGARILLVEDESIVRRVIAAQLESDGHTVCAVADGRQAAAAFDREGPFDLLLTDVVMPGELQGPELARRLREADPALRVVFQSGYPRDMQALSCNGGNDAPVLMKPIKRHDLLQAVAAVLRRRP